MRTCWYTSTVRADHGVKKRRKKVCKSLGSPCWAKSSASKTCLQPRDFKPAYFRDLYCSRNNGLREGKRSGCSFFLLLVASNETRFDLFAS